MNIVIRRIGNSLGVIIPKGILDAWTLGEGDMLTVNDRGISPPKVRAVTDPDEDKWRHAMLVIEHFTPRQIRAKSLANLHRWKAQGAWISAYDEWLKILHARDDGALYATMLGRDERSTRLRQSMPYVGLLTREQVHGLNEQATG